MNELTEGWVLKTLSAPKTNGKGQGGGMKSLNKGPKIRLKLNVALNFGNVLFPGPMIK